MSLNSAEIDLILQELDLTGSFIREIVQRSPGQHDVLHAQREGENHRRSGFKPAAVHRDHNYDILLFILSWF